MSENKEFVSGSGKIYNDVGTEISEKAKGKEIYSAWWEANAIAQARRTYCFRIYKGARRIHGQNHTFAFEGEGLLGYIIAN